MRITLNLASKPFIELRPLYARLRWLMAILLLAAIPLWFLLKVETRKAALVNAKLQRVENNIRRLQAQQRSYQAMMRQPQNAAVLTQAAFLNQLFARKAFSWTAIMMDLETVLPAGVQVMCAIWSIRTVFWSRGWLASPPTRVMGTRRTSRPPR
jgi:type IV pilus assembly protein PilN